MTSAEANMPEGRKTATYDPMVYDVMHEVATQLGGRYIWLSRQADSMEDRDRWLRMDGDLWVEKWQVDADNEAAVRAKTQEYARRLRELDAQ
jgi:hypothetical protein